MSEGGRGTEDGVRGYWNLRGIYVRASAVQLACSSVLSLPAVDSHFEITYQNSRGYTPIPVNGLDFMGNKALRTPRWWKELSGGGVLW